MTTIYTSDIHYRGNNKLNVTKATGIVTFAPTWNIITGLHQHTLSETEYQEQYLDTMKLSYKTNTSMWQSMILDKDEVVLCCYCLPNSFCHRYLLAAILKGMGCKYQGELIKIGKDYQVVYPSIMDRFYRSPIWYV